MLIHVNFQPNPYWSFEIFERPMVIDSLNLYLSQISCQIVDFNGFVDLWILADLRI